MTALSPGPIRVYIMDMGRTYYYLQWIDPTTGERKTESSRCKKRSDAERARVHKEDELNSQVPKADGRLPWADFILLYDESHLSSLAEKSRLKSLSVLTIFHELIDPATVGQVSPATIIKFAAKLRARTVGPRSAKSTTPARKMSESTIKVYLATLRAALGWAKDAGYIGAVPSVPKVARASKAKAKGRPLTAPEFVAMLRAVGGVVGKAAARSWRRLLRGLWLSGLRLGEALDLSWDDRSKLWIDTDSGPYPLLGIVASSEKGFTDRLLPLTPDFCRWALRTPQSQRTGPVFKLVKRRHREEINLTHVSKIISAIGEASGVVVNTKGKFASAHDLRRSFGLRWSKVVMPAELQQLMRHENIATTMAYYAVADATDFAAKLWKVDPTLHTTPAKKDDSETDSKSNR